MPAGIQRARQITATLSAFVGLLAMSSALVV